MNVLAPMAKLHTALVHQPRVRRLSGTIQPLLRGRRILDVGCGDGRLGACLREVGQGCDVLGADVFPRLDCRIPVSAFDGAQLPFADHSFDTALLVDVLHHAQQPTRLLAECARVAARVVVKDHLCSNAFDRWMLALMDWVGNRAHGVHLPYRYLNAAQWDVLICEAGLVKRAQESLRGLYPFPFSLLFSRSMHVLLQLEGGLQLGEPSG